MTKDEAVEIMLEMTKEGFDTDFDHKDGLTVIITGVLRKEQDMKLYEFIYKNTVVEIKEHEARETEKMYILNERDRFCNYNSRIIKGMLNTVIDAYFKKLVIVSTDKDFDYVTAFTEYYQNEIKSNEKRIASLEDDIKDIERNIEVLNNANRSD